MVTKATPDVASSWPCLGPACATDLLAIELDWPVPVFLADWDVHHGNGRWAFGATVSARYA